MMAAGANSKDAGSILIRGHLQVIDSSVTPAVEAPGPEPDATETARPRPMRSVVRWALILLGTLCLALGIVGVVVPVLPTTPFLILAAACYMRASRRLYDWLVGQRRLAPYLPGAGQGRGIPLRVKIVSLSLAWTGLVLAAVFATDVTWIRVLLLAIGVGKTVVMVRLPTLPSAQ